MPKLSSSEAAYLLGVSTDTLRRWEEEKKLIPERTEGGHRRYDSPEEELVKDVLEIITVFSAKLHSMRKDLSAYSRKNVALLEENLSKLAEISI